MRKIVLYVLGAVLLLVAFFIAKSIIDSKNKPQPKLEKDVKTVFVQNVTNTSIPIIINANGVLVAKQRVELYAEVQGIFKPTSRLFRAGQAYNKGQLLLQIDKSEFYASVQSSKSNLYNLITSILPDLKLDYPKVFAKWEEYISKFDINKTTPPLPEITSEKERYFISGRGILTNYYNVKNLEVRLAKFNIVAPFNGILSDALVTEGTLIRSGQKLGEFINTDVYELQVSISSKYINLLKVGESVDLSDTEGNLNYTGKISRINKILDRATQTVTAFIDVQGDDLREGMFLEAKLHAENEPNAIEIDRSLLFNSNKVFVVRDTILDEFTITPIHFTDSKVIIKDLPNGAKLLAKPVPGAFAGMAVKVFNDNQ